MKKLLDRCVWIREGGRLQCRFCGFVNTRGGEQLIRACDRITCQHLGPRNTRQGKPDSVRIGCQSKTNRWFAVYKCAEKRRCLPDLVASGERLEKWRELDESKIFTACHHCEEFEPIEEEPCLQ